MLLSINIPPYQWATDLIKSAVPQAHKIFTIARYTNGGVTVYTEHGEYNEKLPESLNEFLNKYTSGWYDLAETPFGINQKIGQISLEMELHKDYCFIKNLSAPNCTLFLLVQCKPYGPSKNTFLLSNEKKIIEHTIRGFLISGLAQLANDASILRQIAKSNELVRNDVNEIQQKLDYQSKNYEIAITQFIQLILNKLQDKYNIKVRMARDFVNALKTYNLPFEELEENLEQHIQIEINLAMIQGENEIVLNASHLSRISETKAIKASSNEQDSLHLGRYAKTYKVLGRYEKAAELVQQQGLPIIGKHIGTFCSPSVSNASITDALNKHARHIYELFNRYPDSWPIIRNEFRSVANIIEKETTRRQEIA